MSQICDLFGTAEIGISYSDPIQAVHDQAIFDN